MLRPWLWFNLLIYVGLLNASLLLPQSGSTAEPTPPPPPPSTTTKPTHAIVAPFARFSADEKHNPVPLGQLLLGELNCVSCHQADPGLASYVNKKQAPLLDNIGGRVTKSFLRKFLSDPQGHKPGTTMPDMLAALPEKEKAEKVTALLHFLASTASPKVDRPDGKAVAAGREQYHKIGCVACHGTRTAAGDADVVFADAVPLGDLKGKYTLSSLKSFLENPHSVRPSGRMPGLATAKEANEIANYLLQGQKVASLGENLNYSYYEGDFDKVPDFEKAKPSRTGKSAGLDLSVAKRGNDYALRFEGYLKIENEGNHKFFLHSDDGSKLWINEELVVTNDGVHPPSTKEGRAFLTKGLHKFVVGFFNAGGGAELSVEISGPKLPQQSAANWLHLTKEGKPPEKKADPTDEELLVPEPGMIEKGRVAFAELGCASCHQLTVDKKKVEAKLLAQPLNKLKPVAGGCLDKAPKAGLPKYALSSAQVSALQAALSAPVPKEKPDAKEVITRTLTTFNCYMCHDRDKVGGVPANRDVHFKTIQPEMGDEGRIPPSLNGVGAKLTANYFKKILDQGSHDRPYMATHMPKFGEANVGPLVAAFESLDKVEPVEKVTYSQPMAKVKADARHLVSGQALGCVKCHPFAGQKAEGIQAIDLTLMPQRLKHDWYHRYLVNPAQYRPGTRMPTSWPDGNPVLPEFIEGSTAKQIEAIWLYTSDGNKAQIPVGMGKTFIPLTPTKEAIIYRNFVEGAGPRAIAVGYPEGAHLAFDANQLRLALLWQGHFMDASRHWTDRGVGYQPPLGDNVLPFANAPGIASLEKADSPWPTKTAKELGQKFEGYKLSSTSRPTFYYNVEGTRIEDHFDALATKPLPTCKRTVTATGKSIDSLWLRVGSADKIELVDGWYKFTDGKGEREWKVQVDPKNVGTIRKAGEKSELILSFPAKGSSSGTLTLLYAW